MNELSEYLDWPSARARWQNSQDIKELVVELHERCNQALATAVRAPTAFGVSARLAQSVTITLRLAELLGIEIEDAEITSNAMDAIGELLADYAKKIAAERLKEHPENLN